jgi:predicted O-methyltransferase YrrM
MRSMRPALLDLARRTIGFMPEEEGIALYEAGSGADGPFLEIGSYCGKSSIYLGGAARERDTVLYSIDHHRGSEEHRQGEVFYDPRLADASGRIDTLPSFARTIKAAGLTGVVLGIAADSATLASAWRLPLGLVFLDGSHSNQAARSDYEGWAPHLRPGGLLCIHDVFPDPADGGRPPFEIYRRAVNEDGFEERTTRGSLRVLRRSG